MYLFYPILFVLQSSLVTPCNVKVNKYNANIHPCMTRHVETFARLVGMAFYVDRIEMSVDAMIQRHFGFDNILHFVFRTGGQIYHI